MLIELHLLQNFAPSNLNRDDTGAPKDCELGGHRRARISSQCLKRAVRQTFKDEALLAPEQLAARTKRAAEAIASRLEAQGRAKDEAVTVAGALLNAIKPTLHNPADGKTQYLLFLGGAELDGAASIAQEHWEALLAAGKADAGAEAPAAETTGRTRGAGRRPTGSAASLPTAIKAALIRQLDGGKSADIALFGRMLADLPDQNVDAASQVAHAVSTNRVSMEMDFYTAVDDLKPDDTAGADMLGTIEFNSACFYRYSNVDLAQLRRNLGDDTELARKTLEAFVWASILAIPTGKQNSMAAHNPPSLILAVARESAPWNLANAFTRPVTPGQSGDLVERSITALDTYWGALTTMYGTRGIVGQWVCTTEAGSLAALRAAVRPNVDALVQSVMEAASFEDRGTTGAGAGRP